MVSPLMQQQHTTDIASPQHVLQCHNMRRKSHAYTQCVHSPSSRWRWESSRTSPPVKLWFIHSASFLNRTPSIKTNAHLHSERLLDFILKSEHLLLVTLLYTQCFVVLRNIRTFVLVWFYISGPGTPSSPEEVISTLHPIRSKFTDYLVHLYPSTSKTTHRLLTLWYVNTTGNLSQSFPYCSIPINLFHYWTQ